MTRRRKWALVPGFIAIAAVVGLLSAYSGASSSQGFGPEQPVAFPHPVHVKTLGMNCLYCHYAANKSPDPGMPAMSTCMGCHTIIGSQRPQIGERAAFRSAPLDTLTAYWARRQPVPWVRIHKVPDYVRFPHMRHVNAGVTCQTCHGPVQDMDRVSQYASLNMGWCVNCHVSGYKPADGARLAGIEPTQQDIAAEPKRARYDCAVCHY
jgi:hypothetical protein